MFTVNYFPDIMDTDSESDLDLFEDTFSSESDEEDVLNEIARECSHHCERQLRLTKEEDGISHWMYNPRSLQCQSSLQLVMHCSPSQLGDAIAPGLYPLILGEALRIKSYKFIPLLVSEWPLPVLDLNAPELYPNHWMGRFTRRTTRDIGSMADLIVEGLLTRKPHSRLKRIILPHGESEAAAMLKKFVHLPLFSLKNEAYHTIKEWFDEQTDSALNFKTYLGSVEIPTFKETKNGTDASKGSVVICGPAVIQWVGKNRNYEDFLVGMALQRHTPFSFMFDKVVIKNGVDLNVISKIFHLIEFKEKVKQVVFDNRLQNEAIHILFKMNGLSLVLRQFPNIESFLSQFDGIYMTTLLHQHNVQEATLQSALLLAQWRYLQELDISGNLLTARLSHLLGCLDRPLLKLNLSATGLYGCDIEFLADSIHAASLEYLNLDYVDLQTHIESTVRLVRRLQRVLALRTCCTRLAFSGAMAMATALGNSTTLASWNLMQNDISTLPELEAFLLECRKCISLRDIGCKPYELHALFAGLYVHASGPPPLSEEDQVSLQSLAESLNLQVF